MPNGKHEQSEQRAAERRVLIRGGRVFLGVEHPSERLSIWVRDGEIEIHQEGADAPFVDRIAIRNLGEGV